MTEKCEECGREFDSERGLHVHQAQKHKEDKNEEKDGVAQREPKIQDTSNSLNDSGLNLNIKQVAYGGFLIGLLSGLLLGAFVFGASGLGSINASVSEEPNDIEVKSYDASLGSAEDNFDWEGGAVNLEDRPYIGDSDARVTIVSFEDFSCIWCTRHNTDRAFPELLENDIPDGDVQYFYRHFPRNSLGQNMAEVSECVLKQDAEKFWQAKEHFYNNHRGITQGSQDQIIDEAIQGLDIDQEEFDSCMDSGEARNMVSGDRDESAGYDYTYTQNGQERQFVAATPSFLIHNHETGETHAEAGAIPYRGFQEYINQ